MRVCVYIFNVEGWVFPRILGLPGQLIKSKRAAMDAATEY